MQYSDLIEKKRHGTPLFPVEYYYIDKAHPRYVMSPHWHKEFELVRVVSGTLMLYLNNLPYEMQAGDCMLVEGGCLKRGQPDNCVYECLVFDVSILFAGGGAGRFLEPNGKNTAYKNFIEREHTQLRATVDALMRSVKEAKPFYELETVGLFHTLFYQLYTFAYITKTCAAMDKNVRTVISLLEWIDLHLSEHITLADVSAVTGLSEKYICRIFKEYTAKTVVEYIHECRVEKACFLLTQQSITQTAFDCGFNDLSYFCKIFKKYKGVTPREYKKHVTAC